MKKVFLFACMAIVAMVLFNSCRGSRQPRVVEKRMIAVPCEPTSNYSTPTLAKFIEDNDGAAVVVRQPRIVTNANIDMNTVCALIERGLMEQKFNPRDRILFENAVQKMGDGSDYAKLKKQTQVDLIFEITQFNVDEYDIDEFYFSNNPFIKKPFMSNPPRLTKEQIKSGQMQEQPRRLTYTLKGFSIEIKVILLEENRIAGVFKYYQQPCLDGCEVTFQNDYSLRYREKPTSKDISIEEESARRQSSKERYTKEVSEFINDVVIKTMFAEMKVGGTVLNSRCDQLGQSQYQEQPQQVQQRQQIQQSQQVPQVLPPVQSLQPNATNRAEENKRIAEEKAQVEAEKKKMAAEEKVREEAEKDRQIALSATNSYSMSSSVSDLILQAITKQEPKNANKYKTDEERFNQLKKREEITKYINTITSDVGGYPNENNNYITFFCKKEQGNEMALLFFLDGSCIGIGSKNKGLLTRIPNSQKAGIHNVAIWNQERELFSTPIDFANKTYYSFEWGRNGISNSKETKDTESNNSFVNSFDLSKPISELIKGAIEKQNKKYDTFKTDETRFSNLKNYEDITKYIISMTNSVEDIPQNNAENLFFYVKKANGNELALLFFLDGKCIGAGTRNKGLIIQIPKQAYRGMHTLSIWCSEKELLNTPVNFDFKSNYVFEWNRNAVILAN